MLDADLVFWSKNGIFVQDSYRKNGKFRSERKRHVPDDAFRGNETNDCADTEASDGEVPSLDSNSQSKESCEASAHEALLAPSSKSDKRTR